MDIHHSLVHLVSFGTHLVCPDCQEQVRDSYGGLAKEGPGSLWPKSTLGALADGKRFSVETGPWKSTGTADGTADGL